jgi:hypothetical protein
LIKLGSIASALSTTQADIVDHDNGTGGNAPCLESYIGVWENEIVGYDPHVDMAIPVADGGIVGTGQSHNTPEDKDNDYKGFVIKTKANCTYDTKYPVLTPDGTGCDTWDWVTSFGTKDKISMAQWVAESPDKSYLIVTGIEE